MSVNQFIAVRTAAPILERIKPSEQWGLKTAYGMAGIHLLDRHHRPEPACCRTRQVNALDARNLHRFQIVPKRCSPIQRLDHMNVVDRLADGSISMFTFIEISHYVVTNVDHNVHTILDPKRIAIVHHSPSLSYVG